ncbi:MAG: 3-oxoacyl-ACP synthase [Jatrophihabitantaceae bacterium]
MLNLSYLSAPSYVLGEHEDDYTSIDGLAERAAAFQLQPKPALWGWGTIRRTERPLTQLCIETGRRTLDSAGVPAAQVDALVLCSTSITKPVEDHGQFFAEVLTGLGLGNIGFYGITLNRCTNLLAGIDLATALVASGRYRRVLVITADRVLDESQRMVSYALFSDGAASCLIGSEPTGPTFEVLGCANAQDVDALVHTAEISSELARTVNDRLLEPHGMKLDDICGVMHLNIFLPLMVVKERQANYTAEQIYTGNITRVGHCYAADPLINLLDRPTHPGHHYLLVASVPGSRFGVLLRKLDQEGRR